MATQQSIPQSLTVVPFPAPQQISQLELSLLISLRGRLAQLEGQVENAEQSIKTRLEKGCSVEEGDHVALLKPTNRRNVAWKAIVERLGDRLFGPGQGIRYAEKVLRRTKPTPGISLVIE